MDSDENALVKRRDAEIIARLGAYLYVNQMKPIISAAVEAQLRQGSRIIGEVDSSTQSNLDALLRTIYGVHSKVALELGMSDEDFRKTFSNALAEANKKSDAEREAWSPHAFQVFAKHVHLAEKYYTSGLHLPLMSVAHPPVGAKAKADFITAVTELRDKNVPYEEAASQLKASGNFDFELIKDVVLDESVQVSVRQKAMFIGAVSGDADFIAFLANALVLGKDPKLMIDNPKYGSFGMWSDAKDICERNGMRFE